MSTENQDPGNVLDFKKFGEDFSKRLEQIAEGVNVLGKKVEEQKKEEKEDDHDYSSSLFEEDDKKVEKLVEQKLKKHEEKTNLQNQYDKECEKWDGRAYQEFPELRANKKFEEEVKAAIAETPKISLNGQEVYPPDAVWNATNRVYAKWIKTNRINPNAEPEFESLDHGGFTRKIKGVEITEVQRQLAQRLGISEEKAKEIYKPWNEAKIRKQK